MANEYIETIEYKGHKASIIKLEDYGYGYIDLAGILQIAYLGLSVDRRIESKEIAIVEAKLDIDLRLMVAASFEESEPEFKTPSGMGGSYTVKIIGIDSENPDRVFVANTKKEWETCRFWTTRDQLEPERVIKGESA